MPHITTQPWVGRHSHAAGYDTAMRNFSQVNITIAVSVKDVVWWYGPFAGTSSGAWRSPASLLQERIDHTEFLQHKRSHPSKVTSSAPDGYNNRHSGLVCFWPGR